MEKFLSAWNAGDVAELIALMTEDVTYMSDGGGKVPRNSETATRRSENSSVSGGNTTKQVSPDIYTSNGSD